MCPCVLLKLFRQPLFPPAQPTQQAQPAKPTLLILASAC